MKNENKKALVVYHRVDYDGLFSGAMAKIALEKDGYEVTYLGFNYSDEFLTDVGEYSKVVLVDISLEPKDMLSLREKLGDCVVWIDHHVTAIDKSKEHGYDTIQGIRHSDKAACHLVYEYFFAREALGIIELPTPIALAAAYDTWNHQLFDWNGLTAPFQLGLNYKYSKNIDQFETYMRGVLDGDTSVHQIISCGLPIQQYLTTMYEGWVNRNAFEVTVEDGYRGIAMISPNSSSVIFDSVSSKKYDFYVVIEKKPKVGDEFGYTISMYSDKTNLPLSAGEYMERKYHGGGHRCAAGGKMTLEQFVGIIRDHKV